jgi:hypothetical protein
MNVANTKALQGVQGVLPTLLETNQAVMGPAVVIIPSQRENIRNILAASQYRHNLEE